MSENYKLSYTVKGEETLSLRVYNVGREQCKSLHQWGPGIRNFYLIHHIVSGKGIYKVGNKTYEIGVGNTFLIYPNTEITYIADKEDPWEYYWVGFSGNDANVIINQTDFTKDNPVILRDMDNKFEELLMEIYNGQGNSDADKIKMAGYLMLALSLLVINASQKKVRHTSSSEYFQKALEYIEYNYTQKLTVMDLANYIGLSRSRLYRIFMEYYKKSPIEYILEYRINVACQLLKTTELSISSVGYSVGFDDSLYFSRVFKKIKGVSPRDYIRSLTITDNEY